MKVSVNGDKIPNYMEAGELGESVGLIWGGRWKNADMPHLQVKI